MNFKLFLTFFLIVIMSYFVSGLGVSPGKVEIDFVPNLTTSFDMTVYNNPPEEGDISLYVSYAYLDSNLIEEFKDIVTFEKDKIYFNKQDESESFKVSLNFPEGFSTAGVHELGVGAMPSTKEGGGINIVAGNKIRVLISVPTEYASDKYARIKKLRILNVYADDVKRWEKSNIEVLVKSESDVALEGVYGKIKVMGGGNVIDTLDTNKINLEPGEENVLKIVFEVKRTEPGVLILDVEVFYDSRSEKTQGTLKVLEEEAEVREGGFPWWILIVIFLLIIILLLILLLWKRKKDEDKQQAQAKPAQYLQ